MESSERLSPQERAAPCVNTLHVHTEAFVSNQWNTAPGSLSKQTLLFLEQENEPEVQTKCENLGAIYFSFFPF